LEKNDLTPKGTGEDRPPHREGNLQDITLKKGLKKGGGTAKKGRTFKKKKVTERGTYGKGLDGGNRG